jgi:hypothetical protein
MRHSSAHPIGSINLPMPVIGRVRARLRLLLASESGMALPTALFAMIASMALASVAVLSSVDVQRGSARDHDSKEAIAAADAGASIALWRLNRYQEELSATTPCVGPAGEPLVASEGWCPATSSEAVGDATYTYQVSAYDGTGVYDVVAVGASGKVSRRVDVGLVSYSGKNVFADEKVIGQDNIHLKGSVNLRTDIGTNGNVELTDENGKNAVVCGDVRHGTGGSAPEPDCDGVVTEGEKNLPDITPPADLSTNNSNCRLVPNCSIESEVDTYTKTNGSKSEAGKRTEKEPWYAKGKTINIPNNSTLSMGGRDYLVCGLFVNGQLIMNAESEIRIFVDTPENCGLEPGAVQVEFTASANVSSTGYNPGQNSYKIPGIYVLGESKVVLSGNSGTNEVMVYAPKSEIEMQGNATWKGLFAGKSMYIHGNPTIESDPSIKAPDITFATLLGRTRYVECVGATASPPNAYC